MSRKERAAALQREGLTYREIAEAMGASIGAVSSLLRRSSGPRPCGYATHSQNIDKPLAALPYGVETHRDAEHVHAIILAVGGFPALALARSPVFWVAAQSGGYFEVRAANA